MKNPTAFPVTTSRMLGGLLALSALGFGPIAAAHSESKPEPAAIDVSEQAQEAVAAVEAFTEALSHGDLDRVRELLDKDVLVLEGGHAERSAEQYLGGHAARDAEFLAAARRELRARRARRDGDSAWVASESVLHHTREGVALATSSAETMLLRRIQGQWRIVHIHWSSYTPKPTAAD